jgi:3-(3-hydroxy-phenyl)propionate hydroxylase
VRKLAGIEFEGFTYPERFIKIATTFDFGTANPKVAFRNYFSDPDEWCNLFKVQGKRPPGLWRAIMPIKSEETDEIALSPERIETRLQTFFPNSGRYEIEYVNVYGAHQCVAATFRKGRVLLAGDSAHVNNPIGGMGMNGGIHDGINLADKLARVIHGEAGDDLLDLYSRQRRHAAVKYVQAQTIANKRLMEERDPAVRQKNFDELRRTADNPDSARAYMRRAALADSLRDAAAVS